MRISLFAFLLAVLLGGCATPNRTSVPAEESHYHFTIHHYAGKQRAFLETQDGLRQIHAGAIVSAQPETGVILLKPKIVYKVGRHGKNAEFANYDLRIVVTESTVDLTFDLQTNEVDGRQVYPPEKMMPRIRSRAEDIAISVSQSVEGALD